MKPAKPGLYASVKRSADANFSAPTSAYKSAWIVREYKKRGGTYSKSAEKEESRQRKGPRRILILSSARFFLLLIEYNPRSDPTDHFVLFISEMDDDACKLQASIETLAAKYSEIERNKRRIQVIDLPPPPPKRATRPAAQKRGKIVHETFEIDGIEVKRKTFVPAPKKTSNLERLIKKAAKCGSKM